MAIIPIDTDEIEEARQRLTKAREVFDLARDEKKRSEYETLFKAVMAADAVYHEIRRKIIAKLNLEIM